MKLKTRITFLFVALVGFFLFTTVLSSINQRNLLETYQNVVGDIETVIVKSPEQNSQMLKVLNSAKVSLFQMKNRTAVQIGISVLMILVAFIFGLYLVNQHVNKRLLKVINFYKLNRSGKSPDSRLVLSGNDELNMISAVLNDALDEKDSEVLRFEGRIKQERKLLLSVIASEKVKSCYFRLNGDFIGSNMKPADEADVLDFLEDKIQSVVKSKDLVTEFDFIDNQSLRCTIIGPAKGIRLIVKAEIFRK